MRSWWCCAAVSLASLMATAAEPVGNRDDAYANEPYWYKPGHPVNPAEAAAIQTRPGFVAERVLTVPREMGSWTALGVDGRGRLIAAAQDRTGLFRVTVPAGGERDAETKVEKLGGAAEHVGWSHGVLYAFDSLYVTVAEENKVARTGVYRLQDTDGDDQFDRTTLLFALDGAGEHGPHNLVVAPDGESLMMMCGNATKLPAEFARRRPVATTGIDHLMPPGFQSSEYSAQGWVMRFKPDGSARELICTGLRNAYDLAFDDRGELFTFDSDDEWDLGTPWYRPTRIVHLMSGGEYGWRPGGAAWPDHFEDSVAPVLNVGPSSPTGVVFGYGAKFPGKYQHALFVCDWTFGAIHAVFLQPDGASYRAEIEEFVGGAGLPVTDAVIGKDGAMYFVVGGRRLGSAIYRVRYKDRDSAGTSIGANQERNAPRSSRVAMERAHGAAGAVALGDIWTQLGSKDRAVRFAARVALEALPVDAWRERALAETEPTKQLTALLALVRQGTEQDASAVLRACEAWVWAEADTGQRLKILRLVELALARGAQLSATWRTTLLSGFPDQTDPRVTRELARVLAAAGEERMIAPALRLMAADTGERSAQGLGYFARNPKYGQALRDMLDAPPLLERMHHAQMLLWLADRWKPEQRRRYFELVADAVAHSKGGHSYREFWSRIRETALAQMPAAERDELAAIGEAARTAEAPVAVAQGPGRNWTVEEAAELAGRKLTGRDYPNGKAMFAAAACATCHRLGGSGGNVGPDLSAVGQRFTVRDLLEAIIEPSRAVSDQYQMVFVQTSDGKAVSGRIVARDERMTHVATNVIRPGQSLAIRNDTIVREQKVPVSTMPSGLINALNESEMLDLVAYLVSGGDESHPAFRR